MATDDDTVFEAVRTLVALGEYRDQLPGVPGAALTGGGVFQRMPNGGERRLYTRGSPEHIEARARGLVEKLPPLHIIALRQTRCPSHGREPSQPLQ